MAFTAFVGLILERVNSSTTERVLRGLAEWWKSLQAFVLFVTTFFLGETFRHWRVSIEYSGHDLSFDFISVH